MTDRRSVPATADAPFCHIPRYHHLGNINCPLFKYLLFFSFFYFLLEITSAMLDLNSQLRDPLWACRVDKWERLLRSYHNIFIFVHFASSVGLRVVFPIQSEIHKTENFHEHIITKTGIRSKLSIIWLSKRSDDWWYWDYCIGKFLHIFLSLEFRGLIKVDFGIFIPFGSFPHVVYCREYLKNVYTVIFEHMDTRIPAVNWG